MAEPFQFIEAPQAAPVEAEGAFKFIEAPAVEVQGHMPPATPPVKSTMGETEGGAVTGRTQPPHGFPGERLSPTIGRLAVETLGAAGGATLGATLGGPPGAVAGAGLGAAGGSLLSETFDPTTQPIREATETGLISAAGEGVVRAGLAAVRKAIGKPNEAGEWLLTQAEKSGTLPPPSAVLPDSALLRAAQSIGQADVLFGKRVTDALERTNGQMTDEVRAYINSYLRTKVTADRAFAQWDKLLDSTVGSSGIVPVDKNVFKATLELVDGWERLGLDAKLDLKLTQKLIAARDAAAETGALVLPKLSMSEAEALRTRLYRASTDAKQGTLAGKNAIGGQDYSDAYRGYAQDVGKAIDGAVDTAVKDGRMPLDARAQLQGARDLWGKWKQGERLIDELTISLNAAERMDRPLRSSELFSALKRIDKDTAKVGPVISKQQGDYLTGIAQAMRQAEQSESQKAFSWVVRAGQLSLVTGGVAASTVAGPGAFAVGAMMALTPSSLAWIMTNPKAAALVIRGLQVDAGTAAAGRIAQQFLLLGAKAGVFPPQRPQGAPGTEGINATPVYNPAPATMPQGSGVRG